MYSPGPGQPQQVQPAPTQAVPQPQDKPKAPGKSKNGDVGAFIQQCISGLAIAARAGNEKNMAQALTWLQNLQNMMQAIDVMRPVVVIRLRAGSHAIQQKIRMNMGEPRNTGRISDIQLDEINAFRQIARVSARTADAHASRCQLPRNRTAEVAATDDQRMRIQAGGSHRPCRNFSSQ